MNKKIKMIELLNMIANGELKNNTKFNIINEDGDIIKCKYSSTYPGYIWVIDNEEVSFNYKIDHLRILSYEVEILEDNTEEIEELECEESKMYCDTQLIESTKTAKQEDIIDKINELVKAVNEIRKDMNKEHCCCCGVEITDENRALHNMCKECKYGIDWEEKTK